jgi:DNA-3-methyladenine glycosylase
MEILRMEAFCSEKLPRDFYERDTLTVAKALLGKVVVRPSEAGVAMYYCLNVVTQKKGRPECVLIRALAPVEGLELMKKRRREQRERRLCDGPGKLCSALGISMAHYGEDLCGGRLYITEGVPVADDRVAATPRIHIDYANEAAAWPWRFVVKDSPFLSRKFK